MTGRRLVLGNGDVRISYVVAGRAVAALPQRDRRRVRLRRGGPARSRRSSASFDVRAGDYVVIPRATTHRWVPRGRARAAARLLRSRPTRHIAPPKRYLSRYGQLLEHAPYCERDLHGPAEPLLAEDWARRRTSEVFVKHRGPGRRRRRAPCYTYAEPPVRRGRLGRLPLPLHVQRRGLRADHRPGPPAAAGAPGVRGLQLRGLQLRAAQGRLPPAVDPGALLPLQRRQRRGHVLRRRRLRGAQGLRASARARSRCTRAATPTGRSRAPSSAPSASSTSTSSPSWSTRSGRSSSARPARGRGRPATPSAGSAAPAAAQPPNPRPTADAVTPPPPRLDPAATAAATPGSPRLPGHV